MVSQHFALRRFETRELFPTALAVTWEEPVRGAPLAMRHRFAPDRSEDQQEALALSVRTTRPARPSAAFSASREKRPRRQAGELRRWGPLARGLRPREAAPAREFR